MYPQLTPINEFIDINIHITISFQNMKQKCMWSMHVHQKNKRIFHAHPFLSTVKNMHPIETVWQNERT